MTENEKINGWTFEETVKIAENLMEAESNMLKWDILRHLRDFLENYKDELEQYRAIGTVEQLEWCKDASHWKELFKEKLEQYEAICTIEEFKRAKEMEAVYGQVKWERDIAISQLEEIGVALGQKMEEFKTLKEKSVAKKQGNINDFDSHLKLSKAGFLCCSSINKDIRYPLISLSDLDYCPRCGQKLDWQ